MNIVVYYDGSLLKPDNLFFCAQGIASRVNKFPSVPTNATIMHLRTSYTINGLENITYITPAVKLNDSSKGNVRTKA
jgi:hypothetical protein